MDLAGIIHELVVVLTLETVNLNAQPLQLFFVLVVDFALSLLNAGLFVLLDSGCLVLNVAL